MKTPKPAVHRLREFLLVLAPPTIVGFITVAVVAFIFASQGYECNNTKQPPIIPSLPRTDSVPK